MNEELVKKLRRCGKGLCTEDCPDWTKENLYHTCQDELVLEAADAIEELLPFKKQVEKGMGLLDKADELLNAVKLRWIPVTERLPEKDGQVLAYYGFNRGDGYLGMMFMQVLDYYATDPNPHFQHESMGVTVTHWMPLPEPPKEEV